MDAILNWFQTLPLPKEIIALFISMLPIIELRGGLPVASLMGMPYLKALGICMLGNFIPIPFILWLIIPIFAWLKTTKLFSPLVNTIESKTLSKKERLEKGEFWGLMIFVGIPLPGTGAWTGALLAALLGIKFKKAIVAIICGICIAAAIMSFISYGIPFIVNLF
ncbi:MAG: small multi-drug export protein [Clostridiales bacterium]|nr:small multi-drug export protein [Candidatus Equinaster intestinalis]